MTIYNYFCKILQIGFNLCIFKNVIVMGLFKKTTGEQ